MKTILLILTFTFIYSIAVPAIADVLPEGKKRVPFYFKIDNASEFPDYVIIAYPINISNGVPMAEYEFIDSAKSIYTSCKYFSPGIYVLERDKFSQEEFYRIIAQQNDDLDYLKELGEYLKQNFVELTVASGETLIDEDSPVVKITAVYTLGIENGSLTLVKTQIVYDNMDGSTTIDEKTETGSIIDEPNSFSLWYLALPFVSLGAIVTIVIIRRKK